MQRLHIGLGIATTVAIALGAGCGSGSSGSLGPSGNYNPYGPPQGESSSSASSGASSGNSGSTVASTSSASSTASSSTPSNLSAPEQYFINSVYPQITMDQGPSDPSCSSCHATGTLGAPTFLAGANAEAVYMTITTWTMPVLITIPNNSMLVLHGAHEGPALNAAQTTVVTQWLTMEAAARNINPTPTKTVESELTAVAQCMTLANFTAQGPAVDGNTAAASDLGSDNDTADYQGNQSPCNTCHAAGDGGFAANSDPQMMLTMIQSDITYVKKWITGTVDMNGNFSGLVASNAIQTLVDESQTCANQGECHPKVNLNLDPTTSPTLSAINYFVQQTLTLYNNNECQ